MQSVAKPGTCLPDGAQNLCEQTLLSCSVYQTGHIFYSLCLIMRLKTFTQEGPCRVAVDLHCKTPRCCNTHSESKPEVMKQKTMLVFFEIYYFPVFLLPFFKKERILHVTYQKVRP